MLSPFFLASLTLVVALFASWWIGARRHRRKLAGLELRVHVNGTRGKSTVTRLLAGLLREAGYRTVGKTTGSAAAVIAPDGVDVPIRRRGAATILEQMWFVERWVSPDMQALVIECMALDPRYQAICEQQFVRSKIGVLTNVREDHQDVMGETLEEIARSMMNTCPQDGVLVTGEQDPRLIAVLGEEAARRGARLVVAPVAEVAQSDLDRFEYASFAENVAIGFAVAELLGIPRDVALRGMWRAAGDPGVLRVRRLTRRGVGITWANLFAVNDRESLISGMRFLERHRRPDARVVGILNNRRDREARALQFADVAAFDVRFDFLVTFGAFENQVARRLVANGFPAERIVKLATHTELDGVGLLDAILDATRVREVLLVGFVNIHTHHAERLLHALEHDARSESVHGEARAVEVG